MIKQFKPKPWTGALMLSTSALLAGDVFAWPSYVQPTGAKSCESCHQSSQGNGYLPGILEAARSPLGKIAGLKAFINKTQVEEEVEKPNTAPVLHPINTKWDITVGEAPLIVPFQVSDKEEDDFILLGSMPSGISTSQVYNKNNLPTIDLKWSPTAAQANKNYFINVYAQETGDGRALKSNLISANIQVWPARNTKTKFISQFIVQGAQWQSDTLTLSGQLIFKRGLSPANRRKALSSLAMDITSASGASISQAVKLTLGKNGSWTNIFTLNANETPCIIRASYEGLNAARPVSQAPFATCVK